MQCVFNRIQSVISVDTGSAPILCCPQISCGAPPPLGGSNMRQENRGPAPPGGILIEDASPTPPTRPMAAAASDPPGRPDPPAPPRRHGPPRPPSPPGDLTTPAPEPSRLRTAGSPAQPPGGPREPSWAR